MTSEMEEVSENVRLELAEMEESHESVVDSPKTPASESGVAFDLIYPETESFENTHQVAEPVQEPVQAPAEEPVQEPAEESVQAPAEESVQAPAEESVQAPAEEPVQAPAEEPVQEPVPEPVQESTTTIPKMVFVVPYRDREIHLSLFLKQMEIVLEDIPSTDYKILVVHQVDSRAFNRGAIKNIGFLHVKDNYPNAYRNITLIFNDVDTFPKIKNHFDYSTIPGVIKHFCGFTYALGGIVCINAGDFERLNGFPNFWAWGFEDNLLNHRAQKARIHIDRSNFVDFTDIDVANNPYIASLPSGTTRTTNRDEFFRYLSMTKEGFRQIRVIHRDTDSSKHPIEPVSNTSLNAEVVNITYFNSGTTENDEKRSLFDLRSGRAPFGNVIRRKGMAMPAIPMQM
jgi:hypothetical protein